MQGSIPNMGNARAKDFTPGGVKLDGIYENDRNADGSLFFKDMIREAFGVKDVICGHHLLYVTVEKRNDPGTGPYDFQIVEEIPSADALLFDTDVAAKIWGPNEYRNVLMRLAVEPIATRDKLAAELYYARKRG